MKEKELKELLEKELTEVTEENLKVLDELDFTLAKGDCNVGCSGI